MTEHMWAALVADHVWISPWRFLMSPPQCFPFCCCTALHPQMLMWWCGVSEGDQFSTSLCQSCSRGDRLQLLEPTLKTSLFVFSSSAHWRVNTSESTQSCGSTLWMFHWKCLRHTGWTEDTCCHSGHDWCHTHRSMFSALLWSQCLWSHRLF